MDDLERVGNFKFLIGIRLGQLMPAFIPVTLM